MLHETKMRGSDRLNVKTRKAIVEMVTTGLDAHKAAEKHGLNRRTVEAALRRDVGRNFKTDVFRAFMRSEAEASFSRTVEIAQTAKSEHVRLDANKTIMAMDDRFTEKKQVNQVHSGEIKYTPGYVIDLSEEDYSEIPASHQIDNQVIDAEIVEEVQEVKENVQLSKPVGRPKKPKKKAKKPAPEPENELPKRSRLGGLKRGRGGKIAP